MDFCLPLIAFLLVLAIIVAVGHGIWLLAAAFFKALFGHPSEFAPPPGQGRGRERRICPGCGCPYPRRSDRCPECGLRVDDPAAQELRQIERFTAYVQTLVKEGALPDDVGEQVYRSLETRQQTLITGEQPVEEPLAAHSTEEAKAPPVWQQLEQLLARCTDIRDMPAELRKQALEWYRQLDPRDETKLSAPALLTLARLLRLAALSTRALRAYHHLVITYSDSTEAANGALEAGQFALREGKKDDARWFLKKALGHAMPDHERHEIEDILRTLGAGAELEPTPVAASVAPAAEPIVATLVQPRRTFGQMLSGFMEESNILWGELVGGLLIVGCSVALVISLWHTLEKIPYFPFVVIAALTWALFGAGLYTLSHWKLEATSRGLLVIATLLTPLNFLVLAGLWRGQEAGLLDWFTEFVGVIGFTFVVWRSGRVLVGSLNTEGYRGLFRAEWLLTLGVVGASCSQLLVPHFVDRAHPEAGPFGLVSFAPVLFFATSLIPVLLGLSRRQRVDGASGNALFLFLGQGAFAVGVALGFLVYWTEDVRLTLLNLALPAAVAGMPLLITGSLLHLLLEKEKEVGQSHGLSLGLVRWIGTGIGLFGMAVMLAALIPAWPRPTRVMGIGFLNCAVFIVAALRYRLPYAHVPAIVCLVLAYVTAVAKALGHLPDGDMLTLPLATSPRTGAALAVMAVLLALGSELLIRLGRGLDGMFHILGSAVVAVVALLMVYAEGTATPLRGALVFGLVGAGVLSVNIRWRQPSVTYAGSGVMFGMMVYAMLWHTGNLLGPHIWAQALLAHATLSVILYLALSAASSSVKTTFVEPLLIASLFASTAAIPPLLFSLDWDWLVAASACAFWLAAIWLVISWKEIWPGWFAGFQSAVVAGTLLGVTAWLGKQPWVQSTEDLFHLWSMQTYWLGLGVLSLFWVAVRRLRIGKLMPESRVLLEPGWPTVDLIVFGLVVVGQLVQSVYAIASPGQFRVFIVPVTLDLPMAWWLVGALAMALLIYLWDRPHLAVLGLLVLGLTPPVLCAESFRGEEAIASGLCWGLSFFFVVGSILVWQRHRLTEACALLRIHWQTEHDVARWSRVILVAGAVVPVLLVSIGIALAGFLTDWTGPAPTSVFARLGWVPTLVVPLILIGVGLFGHGVRENSAGYVFSAGLVFVTTSMIGYALGVVKAGLPLDAMEAIFVLQLGVLTAALWTLGWLFSGRWRDTALLHVQATLALATYLVLLGIALISLLLDPAATMPDFVIQAGQIIGWAALLLAIAAAIWLSQIISPQRTVDILAVSGMSLAIMAACAVAALDQRDWLSYHVLTIAGTLLGLLLLAGSWIGASVQHLGPLFWPDERRAKTAGLLKQLLPAVKTQIWVDVVSVAVVLLALRGAWQDPSRPYWSSLTTLAVAVLIGAQAVWARRPAYVYASGLLLNLVGYLAWQAWVVDQLGVRVWIHLGPDVFDRFIFIQILCLAIASTCWSLVDWRLRLRVPPVDLRAGILPFPHAAAIIAVHLLAMLVLTALGSDMLGMGVHLGGALAWSAIAATFVAVLVCLWDAEASLCGLPAAPLYVLGLMTVGFGLHLGEPTPRFLGWAGALALSAYLLATNLLICLVPRLAGIWRRLRVPARAQSMLAGWYLPAQALITVLAISLSIWMALDFATLTDRLAGSLTVALLALAGMLAVAVVSQKVVEKEQVVALTNAMVLRFVVLGLAILCIIELGWAVLDPNLVAPWLHRNATALAALTVFAGIYTLGRVPGGTNWASCARRMGPLLAGLAAIILANVLVQEFLWFDSAHERTVVAVAVVILVATLLGGLIVSGIWAAVSARNPLKLSDRSRVNCVWAAEFLAVVLLLHLRLTAPHLLPEFLRHNWAFVMMALGFVGVGLGELFQRRGLPMLAEPLRRTGLFLPLLPLVTYLVRPMADVHWLGDVVPGLKPLIQDLDRLPANFRMHSLLWFLLAFLYGTVALLRRGSVFALLAALAANFGLWVIYANHDSLAFMLHPQMWLIPLGLIVLAAEHLNRDRLTEPQSSGIRYLGLLLIYVSSTADMFITGLGHSVLLPILLALLSIAGVFAGILLRVRAFLFQGVTFLFLVVFSQIWYAAVDLAHTWVWWASGIVLGAAILTLFALFEKRRNDLLRMIEEIKSWR